MGYDQLCISSYLTFRYVVEEGREWKPGIAATFPKVSRTKKTSVFNSKDILDYLTETLGRLSNKTTGLLLSGGIDSAILAALLAEGTRFYTIRFKAPGAIDESAAAEIYARTLGSDIIIVDVTWSDYLEHIDLLVKNKKSPLHPIEPALYTAGLQAYKDGVETLLVGNGADTIFGGMDKLLLKDWTLDEFTKRYTFIEPDIAVDNPVSMKYIYEVYLDSNGIIDVQSFLQNLHGTGIIQAFDNAIHASGCDLIAPYEDLVLRTPLNLKRIREGDPKYLLRELFEILYPGMDVPKKAPFPRPMEQWMSNWTGPKRNEFIDELEITQFTGEQKWMLFCLERFMEVYNSASRDL